MALAKTQGYAGEIAEKKVIREDTNHSGGASTYLFVEFSCRQAFIISLKCPGEHFLQWGSDSWGSRRRGRPTGKLKYLALTTIYYYFSSSYENLFINKIILWLEFL